MANPTPKASSTRVQLPVGPSGDEPPNAPEGGLAYANDTEVVRVKTSTGWEDVGGGGGGTITTINSPDGSITVTNPGGPTVSVEVNEANVTLAGDVNGPANANQVNKIHETSGPTQLTIGAIADGQSLYRSGATVIGANPGVFSVAGNIAPLHWWRANNTVQTGGLVDTIVDNGSSVKNFTQTGAARTTTALDANGKIYLAFNGTTQYYTAGVAADWTFANNGTPSTCVVVLAKPSLATALEGVVGTGGADASRVGFDTTWGFASSTNQGLSWSIGRGTAGQYVAYLANGYVNLNVQVWIIRVAGEYLGQTLGGVTAESYQATARINGVDQVTSIRNASNAFSTASPSFPLTLARLSSTSTNYTNCRVYEVIVDNKLWTDEQCLGYEQYAAQAYSIPFISTGQSNPTVIGAVAGGDLSGTYPNPNVSAIHETSGPNQLTIGAVSDGQVLQRLGTALVGVSAGLPTGNPYVDPPLVPSSFDDEFDSGSPDLALRGISIKTAAGVTLTRAGDVIPWDSSGPSTGTYWSTIVGSTIQIMVPYAATSYYVYKAVTLTAGDTYFTRIGGNFRLDSGVTGGYLEVGFYASSGGNPDANNRVYNSEYTLNTGSIQFQAQRCTAGAFAGYSSPVTAGKFPDIRGVKFFTGSNFSPFVVDSANGQGFYAGPIGGAIAGSSVAFFLIGINPTSTGTIPLVTSIDYIRKVTGTAGIAQTPKVSVTGTYAGLPTGNPYIDPPAVANSFDDEFDTGSADLATRGWLIKNSAGTTLTRSGDVDAWNVSGPAAGTYWSTLKGSQLIVQFPVIASTYTIYKAVSPAMATGDIYFARAGSATRLDSTSASGFFEMALYASSGGNPDPNNRIYVSSYGGVTGAWYVDMYRVTASVAGGTGKVPLGAALPDIRGIQYASSATYRPFMTNSGNGDTFSTEPAGAVAGSTIAFAGLSWTPNITYAGSIPFVISIDFFRKVTTGQGIAQTPRPVLWNVVNGNIGAYAAKPAPISTDQIYIADSQASDAIKRATLSSLSTKCEVYRNAALNTPTTGWAKIVMDTVIFDTGSMWNAVNTRFIPNRPGYYLVTVRFRTNSATSTVAGYGFNGAVTQAVGSDASAFARGGTTVVFCNGTTDYIEPFIFSTTSVAFTTGLFDTYSSIVGPF